MSISYLFEKDPKPFFVGFDDVDAALKAVVEEMQHAEFDPSVFPFYNMHKLDSRHYVLEMHMPGFKADELDVEVAESIMRVKGTRVSTFADKEHIFSGISTPLEFTKMFRLSDSVVVSTIDYFDGALIIGFEKVLPELAREGRYPLSFKRGVTSMIPPPPPPPAPEPEVPPAPAVPVAPATPEVPVAPAAPVAEPVVVAPPAPIAVVTTEQPPVA